MSKKNRKADKAKAFEPAGKYTVQVIKDDRIVDAVFSLIAAGLGLWFLYGSIRDFNLSNLFAIVEVIAAGIFFFLGLAYYPRYVMEKIEVDGDNITFHRLWFRTYRRTFKDIEDIFADGKQKSKNNPFKGSGTHAVYFIFKGGRYRLPCDLCDNWDLLKQDLKNHGIAVRR